MSNLERWAGFAATTAIAGTLIFARLMARKVEALVPPDGRLVEIDRQRVHVAEDGAGPPLLLIHGLGGQMRNFNPALVADLARDYRVIRVDRPGSGYSPRGDKKGADLRTQATLIARLIDELGLEKPWLVGHSLGGALALTLAAAHPEKVGGLLLIAPVSQPVPKVPRVFIGLMVPKRLRGLIAHTVAIPLTVLASGGLWRQVFAPESVPDGFAVSGGGALALRPSSFVGASADLLETRAGLAELVASYGMIVASTHILFARGDALLDYRLHGQTTAREIRGARLTLIEGGHMLPFTRPRQVAAWIRQSISGTSGPLTSSRP